MAYVIQQRKTQELAYLPEEFQLPKTSERVILDRYRDKDYEDVYRLLKNVVDEGQTYPQDVLERKDFEEYFLSHDAFVLRDAKNEKVMGSFYVKPNFPGRSSHICNAGLVVHSHHRGKGIGEFLTRKYLLIAKDLGYEASFFNLVYASNLASVKICRKLGFTEVGVVPKAGKLKDLGDVDALQFYYDLTTLNKE